MVLLEVSSMSLYVHTSGTMRHDLSSSHRAVLRVCGVACAPIQSAQPCLWERNPGHTRQAKLIPPTTWVKINQR